MTYRTVDMACPECGTKLQQYEGRDKWRCTSCNGALVGVSEMELDSATPPPATSPARLCPKCQQDMIPFELADLTLDRCPHCVVIWFDRGELGRLRTALAEPVEEWAVRWASFTRFAL
ncbi:MAG: zf-TFIIB domain-containing protein [Deltaproteobacteria bacterium]|nr:zf-TFIIB domain-containing protein [Deltaproteobacteria bacterium]